MLTLILQRQDIDLDIEFKPDVNTALTALEFMLQTYTRPLDPKRTRFGKTGPQRRSDLATTDSTKRCDCQKVN